MSKGGSGLLTALPGSRDVCTPVEGLRSYGIGSANRRVFRVQCDMWSPYRADEGLKAFAMGRAAAGLCGVH